MELFSGSACTVAEGPRWNGTERTLHWVDMRNDKLEQIAKAGILPVIAIPSLEAAVPLARALVNGGVSAIEVTLRTPCALDAIAAIRKAFPKMAIGAGTIFYGYTGSGRNVSFYHITFTNGVAATGKLGGAIYSLGPSGQVNNPVCGIVSNCVFRECSAQSGGGTYCYTALDIYKAWAKKQFWWRWTWLAQPICEQGGGCLT